MQAVKPAMLTICVATIVRATIVTTGGTVVLNEGQTSSVPGVATATFNALPNGGPQTFTQGIAQ